MLMVVAVMVRFMVSIDLLSLSFHVTQILMNVLKAQTSVPKIAKTLSVPTHAVVMLVIVSVLTDRDVWVSKQLHISCAVTMTYSPFRY